MSKDELKELLRENLAIKVSRDKTDGDIVEVAVYFDGELITDAYCF